jgi:MFS family permease
MRRREWLPRLSRDGWLLFATCGLRTFAFGFLSVLLGLYLAALGLEAPAIGGIFSAALAGGAVMTVVLTQVADRIGRRRILILGGFLMAASGAVFATAEAPLVLLIAAVLGTISPSGKEVGPFLSLEQAILPQTTDDEGRTSVFAAYNLVASLAGALGALAVGLPDQFGLPPLAGYRALIWAYAAVGLALAGLFGLLSPAVEVQRAAAARPRLGLHRSRGVVARMAALFGLDAFAGGFAVQGLVAYWFSLRFGADPATLGAIFFGTSLASALSFLAAPALARRLGLLNTMVFTHIPSNVLLILVALMPTLELAIGMLLARHLLSQLDVPTRQSYSMAILAPDERAAASGLFAVARNAASAIAPAFAGLTLANPALGLPFLASGSLKIVYDLAVFGTFRGLRPPEERRARDPARPSPHRAPPG